MDTTNVVGDDKPLVVKNKDPVNPQLVEQWRKDLFQYTLDDDVVRVKSVLEEVKKNGISPTDHGLRAPKYKTTVFHLALQHSKWSVAKHFISNKEYNGLLVEKCWGIVLPLDNPRAIRPKLRVVCVDSDVVVAKGNVGSIIEVSQAKHRVSQSCVVKWSSEVSKSYTCKDETLRVLDNSPLGVMHKHCMCDVCNKNEFPGFRWKCTKCGNYDLCSECYFSDKHDLTHEFLRIDTPGCKGVKVSARSKVKKKKTELTKMIVNKITSQQRPEKEQEESSSNEQAVPAERKSTKTRPKNAQQKDDDDVDSDFRNECYIEHLPKLSDYGEYKLEQNDDGDIYICKITLQDFDMTGDEDCYCFTSLSVLAATGNTELAKTLLGSFTDESVRKKLLVHSDRSSYHGIHLAAANGHTDFVKLLLDFGVDVNCQARHQYTPLMYAVRAQHLETIRILLQGRADLFMSSKRGKTSLYMAVKYGSLELVKELVEEGGVNKFHIDDPINSWQHSSMLFVAAHCGKEEMVEFLLEKGADSNRKDDTGLTALHEAAKNDNVELVKMLLTKGKADVNAEDEHGDTALLFATSENNLNVMQVLTLHGASTSHQNKSGVSMWNYIMNADKEFINSVLKLYREAKKLPKDHCIKFVVNPNPLLIATRGLYFDTLELLLRSNVDPHSTDQDGNTFYHVAARKGILEAFSDRFQKFIRLGDTNKYGQTALHLAAKNEQMKVVKILVRKSKKESRNKHTKRLLLRAAAFGELIVIENLVRVISETDKPWRFQECDDQGNTALHLAAKRGHLQMMECLLELDFDPRARNKAGNTPFHEFMLSESDAEVEDLIHVIHQDVDFNINEVNNKNNETALHMCARLGDWRHFEQLIKAKADLGIQNSEGNTALHVMVEESIRDPGKSCNFIQVLKVCAKLAAEWWRNYKLQPGEDIVDKIGKNVANGLKEETTALLKFHQSIRHHSMDLTDSATTHPKVSLAASNAFYKWLSNCYKCRSRQPSPEIQTCIALQHLLWQVVNKEGQSVIALAVSCGAVTMVDELLDLPNVFRFQTHDSVKYDITFLTPETKALRNIDLAGKQQSTSGGAPVTTKAVTQKDEADSKQKTAVNDSTLRPPIKSCLELVMDLVEGNVSGADNIITAAKILDSNPFKILIDNYRRGFQIIFRLFTIIHIVHMVLFTIYALPDRSIVTTDNNSTGQYSDAQVISGPYGEWFSVFLLWPSLCLFGLILLKCSDLVRMAKSRNSLGLSSCWSRVRFFAIFSIHKIFLKIVGFSLPQLSIIAFSSLTMLWYFLYRSQSGAEMYLQVTAILFILGWLITLYFAKGTQDLIFSAIFERIALRDISRFTFMYTFILIGFGLAFHTLLQLNSELAASFESPLNTLLDTFNLMLGLASPLKDDFQKNYKESGGSPAFVYCIYLLYVVIASIVMINLLIAMMTHSFEDCKQHASILWRVGSLKLALNLIHIRQALPLTPKWPWYTAPYCIKEEIASNGKDYRWMLIIPNYMNEDDSSDRSEKLDAILDATQRLERQLELLKLKLKDAEDESSSDYEEEASDETKDEEDDEER